MLKVLDEFREKLDRIMLKAMHSRIVLYGYGYAGRFLKWYAEYYHSIKVDYTITLDTSFGRPYDQELFQKDLFSFHYKDVDSAVVWAAEPVSPDLEKFFNQYGYRRNETFFDFYEAIYGDDVTWEFETADIFSKRKAGKKDIQFLEFLEWKYGCNFLQVIPSSDFKVAGEHGASFRALTQKEIFPILDKCHCIPTDKDAIFDYGCGKGGAIVSFLDYGFKHAGGVEYEPEIYDILVDNMEKLKLDEDEKVLECIQGNAAEVDKPLDKYNWFYFYEPFDEFIFKDCMKAICKSLKRYKRQIHIISVIPSYNQCIKESGQFYLTNQFTIETRQRVVNVFKSI